VIAHGAILRIRAKNPQIADQIAVNYRQGRHHAAAARHARLRHEGQPGGNKVSEADFAEVAGHGFSDDDIWDITAIAAFFALSNRMANIHRDCVRTTNST